MRKILPPTKDILEHLLFKKLWSKKKVAKHYKVSIKVISRWMKQYNLTGLITPELQAQKRAITNANKPKTYDFKNLLKRAMKGEIIKIPGFNSDFLEEYLIEQEYPTDED